MENIFTCAICGKDYGSIASRNECEANCLEKQRKEAANKERKQKEEQQIKDKQEIDNMFADLQREIKKYNSQYGKHLYISMAEYGYSRVLDSSWLDSFFSF